MLDQEAYQGPAKPSARTTVGGSAGATNANRVCHEQHGGTGGEVDMEQSASLPAGAGAQQLHRCQADPGQLAMRQND